MSLIVNRGRLHGLSFIACLPASPLAATHFLSLLSPSSPSYHPPTSESIHPILNRLGVDNLVSLTSRLRDDERIKSVGPDSWVFPAPTPSTLDPSYMPMYEGEGEVWFDWAFVDFWKSNHCE